MKYFFLILFIFPFVWLCNAKTIYVSSSVGNDSFNGISPNTPLKTITLALTKGDTVLLKANDIFYSKGLNINNKRLSRYDKGSNPIVCGYKRIVSPKWTMVSKHIWRLNLAEDNFSGVVLKGSSMSNNIGCIHEYNKDLIHGRKVQYLSELKENWDIWQTERFERETPANEFDKIYLYYEENPNRLKLEFSITDTALSMQDAQVDGVNFCGYGFGISARSNSIIRNCDIDAIGGRTQIGYSSYVCYGNGIEFWVGVENCLVEDCRISRCYDCGCTIQGRKASGVNILFRNNIIIDCCQGWEDFLTNEDPSVVFVKCVFENNLIVNSGRTSGFGYPEKRFKYCHVLGNNVKGNKGMIIRNNTFIGGNYYCSGAYLGKYKSNVWQGNTCIIKRGDYILSNYGGTKDVIRIPKEKGKFRTLNEATDDAIRRYRELTGDRTTRFVIKSESKIEKRIKKHKSKFAKYR